MASPKKKKREKKAASPKSPGDPKTPTPEKKKKKKKDTSPKEDTPRTAEKRDLQRRTSIHAALKEHSSPDKRFAGKEWQLLFDEESKYPYHYNARTGETKWAEEEEAAELYKTFVKYQQQK